MFKQDQSDRSELTNLHSFEFRIVQIRNQNEMRLITSTSKYINIC